MTELRPSTWPEVLEAIGRLLSELRPVKVKITAEMPRGGTLRFTVSPQKELPK